MRSQRIATMAAATIAVMSMTPGVSIAGFGGPVDPPQFDRYRPFRASKKPSPDRRKQVKAARRMRRRQK